MASQGPLWFYDAPRTRPPKAKSKLRRSHSENISKWQAGIYHPQSGLDDDTKSSLRGTNGTSFPEESPRFPGEEEGPWVYRPSYSNTLRPEDLSRYRGHSAEPSISRSAIVDADKKRDQDRMALIERREKAKSLSRIPQVRCTTNPHDLYRQRHQICRSDKDLSKISVNQMLDVHGAPIRKHSDGPVYYSSSQLNEQGRETERVKVRKYSDGQHYEKRRGSRSSSVEGSSPSYRQPLEWLSEKGKKIAGFFERNRSFDSLNKSQGSLDQIGESTPRSNMGFFDSIKSKKHSPPREKDSAPKKIKRRSMSMERGLMGRRPPDPSIMQTNELMDFDISRNWCYLYWSDKEGMK